MSLNEMQKKTNTNAQEKANLIWDIANHLYGLFKPHEYGKVILPMTVLKRFDDALKSTKDKVLKKNAELIKQKIEGQARDGILKRTSGYDFYNTSNYDFEKLLSEPNDIDKNFDSYLKGFSDNVKRIMEYFEFSDQIAKMAKGNVLYTIITEFNSKKGDMSPDLITSADMGYVFEELIRKFSESYDEQAGAHFTSRDIIYLMTDILMNDEKEEIEVDGCSKTAYDMAMGTSQMLGCLTERIKEINEDAEISCFGQELNPETYAIALSDMMIKGGNANGMKFGDTLSDDQFKGYEFDYIISNPPFGINWKVEEKVVKDEAKLGDEGRFGPGLPSISDGQLLFMLNGIKKLKNDGKMTIIQNGSSLFTGDAGSGPSDIRKHIIENDWLDAIIQLPNDCFYNTGIATYIWIIDKNKKGKRIGKVQLIDASSCYLSRRKNIGSKRVDITEKCKNLILKTYNSFDSKKHSSINEDGKEIIVKSKVLKSEELGYYKVPVETPIINEETGEVEIKKGIPVYKVTDTEIVPLGEDMDAYFEREVKPYMPDAKFNKKNAKIGYEIPFTRTFYEYKELESSEEIAKRITEHEQNLMKQLKELFGEVK